MRIIVQSNVNINPPNRINQCKHIPFLMETLYTHNYDTVLDGTDIIVAVVLIEVM